MELTVKGNWNKIGDGIRIAMMSLSCFIIIVNCIMPNRWMTATNMDTIIGFFLCGIFIVASFNGKIGLNKHSLYILLLILGLGVLESISGISMGVLGYLSNGAFYIIIPTALICVIENQHQIENIMMSLSIGSSAAFLILFLFSTLFSPLGVEQYEAFVFNPNALGMFAAIGFVGAVYLSIKLNKGYKYIALFISGVSLGFIIFSRSRTALLVVIAAAIIIFFRMLIDRKKINFKKLFVYTICVALAVYISYLCVTFVNKSIGLNDNIELKKTIEKHFDINLLNKSDLEKETDIETNFGDILESGAKRSLKGIADGNSFSSGRILIWKNFIEEINLSGHKTGTMKIEGVDGYNAHNAYIQTAYSFGAISGVIYLSISVWAGIVLLISFIKSIKNKRQSKELTGIYLLFAGFLFESVLSAAVSPFSYFFVMAFNLIIIPFISLNSVRSKQDYNYDRI